MEKQRRKEVWIEWRKNLDGNLLFFAMKVINLSVEEEKVPKRQRAASKTFARRNCYYLRVGKETVLPVILLLHENETFSELKFQVL